MTRSARGATLLLALAFTLSLAHAAGADDQADLLAAFTQAGAAEAKADYPEAARQYERALALAPTVVGADSEDAARIMSNLALAYYHLGQYSKAEPLYLRSLKIKEAKLGADHLDVAGSLNNLAILYVAQGQYSQAEAIYQRSLKIREAKLGVDSPGVAANLNNLAILYYDMGQYSKAEPLYQRSLKILEARLGPDHPDLAQNLNNLAVLYVDMGEYAKAEPLYQRSLKIKETKLGPDDPGVAASLNNLAVLYLEMGQYSKAEPLYRRSLKIDEAAHGNVHPDVAADLNNLAALYVEMKQYPQAEPLYQRSLKILEAKLGPDHPDVASSLGNLAALYREMDVYAKAEPLYQRSLKIREAKLGADHPAVAQSLYGLAALYVEMEQYSQAEPLYRRSLKIWETKLGPDHPNVGATLRALAELHGASKQFAAARDEFDRDRRLVRRHVAEVLPMLSEKEQTAFLKNMDREDFHAALSLGWSRPEDAAGVAASAGWLANGKAVAQESLAQRAALARDSDDPRLRPIARRLSEVGTQLANLASSRPKPGQETARLADLARLGEQQQDLSRQLSRAGGVAAPPAWVELDAVRRNLPKDGVLVDIVQFQPFIFGAKRKENEKQPAHYAAWLTPPAGAGEVRVIDLGEAEKIDDAVREYQTAMAAAQTGRPVHELGEAGAAAELQKPLAELARLVLDPLKPALGAKTEIVLSPDANLWLIPWGALPTGEKDQFAIEKWNIHYVTSARDLAVGHKAASTNPPRVFANPNYDLAPTEMPGVLAAIFGGRADAAKADDTRADGTRSVPATLGPAAYGVDRGMRSAEAIGRARLLQGTADEARAILPNLQKYAGQPKLYAENQALEGVFKRLAAPRVLVLSTHGFFLPDQQVKLDDQDRADLAGEGRAKQALVDASGKAIENPLLRCGLLLAGCNQRERIADTNLDDGVLTGMEIVGTNLRGTELVVLSACETGLGQVQNGEGVAGLRQAFQLAGAHAVVATLWQIPDQETVPLMNDFFNNLAAGKSKSVALREAQLAMIQARREKHGAAHPLYWAAFTLTGQ